MKENGEKNGKDWRTIGLFKKSERSLKETIRPICSLSFSLTPSLSVSNSNRERDSITGWWKVGIKDEKEKKENELKESKTDGDSCPCIEKRWANDSKSERFDE